MMPPTPLLAPPLEASRDKTLLLRADNERSVSGEVQRWEELSPWLLDSLQDLQHLSDVLLACLSEADEPEEAARLHYALWLNQMALASTETMMDLLAFPNTLIKFFSDVETGS